MLSEKSRKTLLYAYNEDCSVWPDADEEGMHPSTIRSLVKKGLIAPEDDDDFECEYFITPKGRKALGLHGAALRPPKRIKTAIYRSVCLFLDETSTLRQSIFTPDKIHAAVWVNDEQQADFSDALMVIDVNDADLDYYEPHEWACVGQFVRELGFNCYVERCRYIAAFWPTNE